VADEERGLVLLTGTTGCGKSTTLAAFIDHINDTREAHVMTVEDPIEFPHHDRRALINQRERGDVSRRTALRSASNPDEFKLRIQGVTDLAEGEMERAGPSASDSVITRFGD
jgi:twitching motility protein PilT